MLSYLSSCLSLTNLKPAPKTLSRKQDTTFLPCGMSLTISLTSWLPNAWRTNSYHFTCSTPHTYHTICLSLFRKRNRRRYHCNALWIPATKHSIQASPLHSPSLTQNIKKRFLKPLCKPYQICPPPTELSQQGLLLEFSLLWASSQPLHEQPPLFCLKFDYFIFGRKNFLDSDWWDEKPQHCSEHKKRI